MKFRENESLKSLFLASTVLLGFVFIVSITILYVSDAIKNNNACGCVIPIPYMILILSSLGLFSGSFAFYFLISKHLKDRKELTKNIEFTLGFLDTDERKIVTALIDNKGELNQAEFEKITGFHRVKVHRILVRLKSKGLIEKSASGKSKKIELNSEIRNIFV